jgi:predicted signal transduction protein with EAL and GGDEF domain
MLNPTSEQYPTVGPTGNCWAPTAAFWLTLNFVAFPLTVVDAKPVHTRKKERPHASDALDRRTRGAVHHAQLPPGLLARWGGEEFAIVAPDSPLDAAEKLVEKLRANLEDLRAVGAISVTCSFGVALFKAEEVRDSLIRRADRALYRAKNGGRNRVVVT